MLLPRYYTPAGLADALAALLCAGQPVHLFIDPGRRVVVAVGDDAYVVRFLPDGVAVDWLDPALRPLLIPCGRLRSVRLSRCGLELDTSVGVFYF